MLMVLNAGKECHSSQISNGNVISVPRHYGLFSTSMSNVN